MIEISCVDPVLIVNPRFDELCLRCDFLYLDCKCYRIDPDVKFRIACGESGSSLLHVPFAKMIRKDGQYTDPFFQDYLDRCFLVDDSTGEFFPVYQYVPCGHCSVCKAHKMSSFVQRARFAVEESGVVGLSCTLKYNDEHLPASGVLDRRDVQLFMKRLKSALSRMYKTYYPNFRRLTKRQLKSLSSDELHSYNEKFLEYSESVAYWSKVAAGVKIIYSGEYGDKTSRPHWHILLFGIPFFYTLNGFPNAAFNDIMRQKVVQFAWRVSVPDVKGQYLSFEQYRHKYPRAYKTPKGYDPDSIGHIWMKEINSDAAVRYALKYAMKGTVQDGSKSIYGTSCNLGVNFVRSHFSEILDDVDCKFVFKSVVDGKVCKCSLSSYYLQKLFPSYSKLVPKSVRQAFVDFCVSSHYLVLSNNVLLPEIKKELICRLKEVSERFHFLTFDFRSAFSRPVIHRIISFYGYEVQVQDDLPFLVPQFFNSATFLQDVFITYESSYKILSESCIDYDYVCRQLVLRDEFFSRFEARSRSSILLDGINFDDELSVLISKSTL